MENSSEHERTYLFSFISGMQMVSASVGSWIGGYLPSWVAGARSVEAVSSQAYGGSILVVAIALAIGIIPLLLIKMPRLESSASARFLLLFLTQPKTQRN